MSLIALVTWITTAGGGLYLLSIWLIEYDRNFQAVAATRLPPPVVAGHVLLAGGGLVVWIVYLLYDQERLAWISVSALVAAVMLGLVMAIRWIGVYRAGRARTRLALVAAANGQITLAGRRPPEGPPERNFPLPVVIAHGAFAALTLTLVLLTALGVFGS